MSIELVAHSINWTTVLVIRILIPEQVRLPCIHGLGESEAIQL